MEAIVQFLEKLPIGHQLTMIANKAGAQYAVNVGPASGGPIDAYHIDCSVIDAPIDLCLCDDLFESSDGTYIVGNYGWERTKG